jgi:hypothetical protein
MGPVIEAEVQAQVPVALILQKDLGVTGNNGTSRFRVRVAHQLVDEWVAGITCPGGKWTVRRPTMVRARP